VIQPTLSLSKWANGVPETGWLGEMFQKPVKQGHRPDVHDGWIRASPHVSAGTRKFIEFHLFVGASLLVCRSAIYVPMSRAEGCWRNHLVDCEG